MVFVPDDERDELDRAEGLGSGYEIWEVEAIGRDGDVRLAEVYVACASSIDPTLKPYDWYLSLIIDGAKARGLPESYIEALEKTGTLPDPGPLGRTGRQTTGSVEPQHRAPDLARWLGTHQVGGCLAGCA